MTTVLATRTWLDLARSVAWEYGFDISFEQADHDLWEYTGFPAFWTGDPVECCTRQLHEYYASLVMSS